MRTAPWFSLGGLSARHPVCPAPSQRTRIQTWKDREVCTGALISQGDPKTRVRKGVSALQHEFQGKMTKTWGQATALIFPHLVIRGSSGGLAPSRKAEQCQPGPWLARARFLTCTMGYQGLPHGPLQVVTCDTAPHGCFPPLWGTSRSVHPSPGREQGRGPGGWGRSGEVDSIHTGRPGQRAVVSPTP